MGRPNKIRQHRLEAQVRKLTAQGLTYRQISERLEKDQGVKISHVAVGRFISEETEERKEAVRNVAAKEAQTNIPQASKVLTQVMQMGLKVTHMKYMGVSNDPKKPAPDVAHFAAAAKVTTAAARALYAITAGEEPSTGIEKIRDEVLGILAGAKKRDEAGDEED